MVLAAGWALALRETDPTTNGPVEPISNAAVEAVLEGFEGGTVRLSDFRGAPLVLNYWASWCAPCLDEMPGFEAVYQRNLDRVGFLGVNITDDQNAARAVIEMTGITYPVAVDADGSTFPIFGGLGMPTTVFIDSAGRQLDVITGALSEEALQDTIDTLFGT